VGEAQIEKIYDTMSAATIVKEVKPKAIRVDDSAVIREN
jgi:tetrahydrodipicolinate N-succinyltransferase